MKEKQNFPSLESLINFKTRQISLVKLYSLPRYLVQSSIGFSLIISQTAIAQVIPDATLPVNSIVTPQGNLLTIDGGSRAGDNLFHSFEQFSVLDGNRAFFNNALDIQNIFSRVTGGSISNIEGIIEANGTANLFLINPAGIIFGPNASLNIGGSFLSSTANSIIFTDGTEFSAVSPEAEPLLTINMPLGLGFGENPEPVVNRSFVGLEVPVGETLALIGGDVFIEGGILTAPEGRVELGSVSGNQTVSLTAVESGWQLGYENVGTFQDITLSDFAVVDTSGESGGAVQIQGRNINVISDSSIVSSTFGTETGESVKILASDSINMSGDLTAILTDSSGTGAAGDIDVTTQNLTVQDGAFIGIFSFEEGQTGNLSINASESIELAGTTSDGIFNSGIFVTVENNPRTEVRTLSIDTKNLILRDGASISTNNFGGNQPIDLRVNASESIELLRASADGIFLSGLFARVEEGATGDGGNLTVDTQQLTITEGAQIFTATLGNGNAGDLTIRVTELIQLTGVEPNRNSPSRIVASTESMAEGNGGNLSIETGQLLVQGGAQITATTFGMGNAGTLNVQASDFIQLEGRRPDGINPSGLFAQVATGATGDGGELIVETPRLIVLEGAQIAAGTRSEGKGGDVIINVSDSVLLSGTDPSGDAFSSSGIFVSAELGATKEAGTLNLTTSELTVEKGAKISADNFGTGTGSNSSLNINRLIIQEGGQVGAGSLLGQGATDNERGPGGELIVNAAESIEIIGTGTIGTTPVNSSLFTRAEGTGNAGNLNIMTPQLTVAESGNINVSATGTGEAGTLTIESQEVTLDRGNLTAETRTGDRGNITISQADILLLRNNSQITTNATEEATGGNITITSEVIALLDSSKITANAVEGRGGNIQITTQGLFLDPDSEITASSELGIDGTVTINEPDLNPAKALEELPTEVIDVARLVAQNLCKQDEGSEFILTGKGGLAPTPTQARNGEISEVELVEPATFLRDEEVSQVEEVKEAEEEIIEAQGWIINERGNVELIASKTDSDGSPPQPKNARICQN